MAIPVVAARSGGVSSTTDGTSHAITLPAGAAVGDLLIVVFSADGNPTCTATAGWSKVGQASNGTIVTGAVFYKVATGSDACTVTTSAAEQSSHVSLLITGAAVPQVVFANGSSTNSDPPALTFPYMTSGNETLWIASRSGDAQVVATAAPASFANLQTQTAAGTNGASTNTAEFSDATNSNNPGTFTSATEQWVCATIGVPAVKSAISGLTDAFTTMDTAKWNPHGASLPAVSGGQLVFQSTTATGYYGVESKYGFDLTGGSILLELVNAGNQAIVSYEGYPLRLYSPATTDTMIGFFFSGGTIYVHSRSLGGTTSNAWSTTYVNATHRWLRFRESGGTVYAGYSGDGTNWTEPVSYTATTWPVCWGPKCVIPGMQIGTYAAETLTTQMILDNVNLPPGTPVTSGRPKVRIGGAWVQKPTKVRISGAWVEKPVKVRVGGAWKTVT